MFLLLPSVAAATTATPGWRLSTSLPVLSGLFGVSCGSANACFALGFGGLNTHSVVLATSNAGKTWTTQNVPDLGPDRVGGISCVSARLCEAVGTFASLSTNNGGNTWVAHKLPNKIRDLYSISCASSTVCEAAGDAPGLGTATPELVGMKNGSWTRQRVPSGLQFLYGVSCPSPLSCKAVGAGRTTGFLYPGAMVITTSNGGITWATQKEISAPQGWFLQGISCVSSKRCEAVGATSLGRALVLSTINGGTTWTIQTIPPGSAALEAVSCRSSRVCEAVGQSPQNAGVAIGTVNGGASWSNQKLPAHVVEPNGMAGIACVAAPAACFAVGESSSTEQALILVYR
jgi:photosystem II stability/assembly factor-like uncharacterized protein